MEGTTMSAIIWGLAGWALLSVPFGLMIGRRMARMNPATQQSDSADWDDIRTALTGMLPGSGKPRPAPTDASGWAAVEAEAQAAAHALPAARKVA
jgi:hypothetical protein